MGVAVALTGVGLWWLAPDFVAIDEAQSRYCWGRWSAFRRWPTGMRVLTLVLGRLSALGFIGGGIAMIVTGI
jgi:hypothetical protein